MKRLTALVILALVLMLALPVGAQDGMFGLTAEDLQVWGAANENSLSKEQFSFNYDVTLDVSADGETLSTVLNGGGALDITNEVANLTANGTASFGAESAVLEGELRVLGEMLYARATDPTSGSDTGWFSVNLDQLETAGVDTDALGGTLTDAFFEGFAEGAGASGPVNPEDFTGLLFAAMTIDPSQFIFMSRNDNGDGTNTFTVDVSLSSLAQAEGFDGVVSELLRASQIAPEATEAEAAMFSELLSQITADTIISLDQIVDMKNQVVTQASIVIASTIDPAALGESGSPVTVAFSLVVDVSGYDMPASIATPEGATEIPASLIADGVNSATGGSTGGSAAPMGVDGGSIGVGQTMVVTVPDGGSVSLAVNADGPIDITARSLGDLDPILTVYDAAGTEVAYNDDNDGVAGLNFLDSAVANVNGAARIDVRGWSGSGDVEVSVMAAGSGGSAAVPPSGNAGGSIAVGETTVVAVPDGGTVDLTLNANGPVNITAASTSGMVDPIITVFDTAGNEIGYNDDHSGVAGLGTLDSALEDFSVNGQVRVQISLWSGNGDIEVSVMPAGGGAAAPSTGAATVNVGGSTVVNIPANGTVNVTVNGNGPVDITARALTDGLDPLMTVYDASGNQIGYNDDNAGVAGLNSLDAADSDIQFSGSARIELSLWFGATGDVEVSVMPAGGAAVPPPSGGNAAPAETVSLTCFSASREFSDQVGSTFSGTCPANCDATVWGTDIYTDDSSICTAAVHAGVIPASGGAVTFTVVAGQDSYTGTTQNGVTTSNYGSWGGSFSFVDGNAAAPSGGAAASSVNVAGLDMSGSFPSGISYSYPSRYSESSNTELLAMLTSPSGMGFVQIFDTTSLFGDVEMGKEFFQDTYGNAVASTWGFTLTA